MNTCSSKSQRYITNWLFAFILLIGITPRAFGQVTVSVTQDQGLYVYNYTVQNAGLTSLVGFDLTTPSIRSFTEPSNWVGSFAFGEMVWNALSNDGIAPGNSLSGFSVLSEYAPGDTTYSLFDENENELQGAVVGPLIQPGVAAPEPSSSFLIGVVGVLSFLVLATRLHRRTQNL